MSRDEDCDRWIKETMTNVIETLGVNKDDAHYELATSTDIYSSTMHYVTVKFKSKTSSENEEYALILKRPMQIEIIRELFRVDFQFHNEILFYQTYARPGDNFPRCFYTAERPPTDSVLALENVTKSGYHAYPQGYNAPLEYTLAAMREIGRFHGKGYVMKKLQREEFFGIVERIQEGRYDLKMSDNYLRPFFNCMAPRAVEYLRRQGYDPVFCDKTETLLSDAFDRIMLKTVQPQEPLSTLCHGDFTLNNMLFKAEGDGQYRAMLIDFALIIHATPVVDLSTYLCLSCSNEIRKEKFPEIMRAYHDALKEYLQDAGIWDAKKYSYDAIVENYVKGSLFGFVIASFYLVILMGRCTVGPEQLVHIDTTEFAMMCKEAGGDEMSKILADMLLELKDLGCLKHLL
ncbi:hypothetical protein DMN91_004502 [Ooceraea biroi]|uniref:CHK kinase-like domain-containing protein n=1 Tax=Ooceraea biroi TaxID=2015173 RepID=A0A026WHA6_OOCBI|nr:uncharacterized protein LOC105279237 [Ooceraea biroi]EZA55348.1 hypothetical protein X777_04802 [Ooceraea biroi]RLU22224.1 hypothetical protein DMN91_004502 [Ooceraea biroi]